MLRMPCCMALAPNRPFVPFLPARACWDAGRQWLSQRCGSQMPNRWGIFSPVYPLHPLFLPTSQRILHQPIIPVIYWFLWGEQRGRGVACPRAAITRQASDRGGIKISGLQLHGFFTPSSLIYFFKCFKKRKYNSCRIKKGLCHKVVYVSSAQGWFERSPRSHK